MLSRNAEALFWIGRYMERAENHARLIDVYYHFTHDGLGAEGDWRAARIIDALGARQDYEQRFPSLQEEAALTFVTLDRNYMNSLFSCIAQARNNLRTLREKLPSELWDALNSMYLWLMDLEPSDQLLDSPHPFYQQVKDRIAVFWGVQQSVMMRENEWHLIESGKYLERAENVVRILRSVTFASHPDETAYPYWLALLRSVSGYQAFRKTYADNFKAEPIMEFLVSNLAFPRSVHHAVSHLEQHMKRIEPGDDAHVALRDKVIRKAAKLRADIACLEREDFAADRIDELLSGISQSCMKIGSLIAESFFRREEATA
jgi:Uncharacterized protein conserved in bacteria